MGNRLVVRSVGAFVLSLTFVAAGLVGMAPAQAADPVPPPAPAANPETVTADPLPTVQINGVVWDQAVAGNTVYAVGNFTSARPAGSPAGTNEVARSYILAYNLQTGALINSFAPVVNGQIQSVSVSPDGARIYIGGQFTRVNGWIRNRMAALTTSGSTVGSFDPSPNGQVLSVHATADAVYFGGTFTSVATTTTPVDRFRAASAAPANGAILPFAPNVADRVVRGIYAVNNKVAIGGSFSSVNNSDTPGYGLALLSAADGSSLPMAVNNQIRNGGDDAAIWSLTGDATGFYGSGYHFGGGGNLEGSFKSDWDGNLSWVEDCHGDTYDVVPAGDVVYSASHKHYCGNLGTGGFPQTDPWSFWHGTATTNVATGTSKSDIYGYPDHPGQPSPTLLNFFPYFSIGNFTGMSQATWNVSASANGDYVVYGGEFKTVNSSAQQGIVRFAKKNIAPNKVAPRLGGAAMNPTPKSLIAGTVRVSWPANWDRDDETLTYKLLRRLNDNVVTTVTQKARFWEGKRMSFTDTGLPPGVTQRYRVQTTDAAGNSTFSDWVDVVVASEGSLGTYGEAVFADGASKFWRLGEPDGNVYDWAGADDTTSGSGVTRGAEGALLNSTDTASTFNGTGDGLVVSKEAIPGPDVFSTEVWFKTTSNGGGKIAGFGSGASGNSNSYDRHIYMDGSGRVTFGVYTGQLATISSASGYNDGQWHQAVATLGANGMVFYLDGKRVGTKAGTTSGQAYTGYWRIGGDNTWAGNQYLDGNIDEFSVYPTVLSGKQVNEHWMASGRPSALPTAPADAYGKAVFNADPDLFWRLDETTGNTAADASVTGNPGTYFGRVVKGDPGVIPTNAAVRLRRAGGGTPGGNVVASRSVSNPTTFTQEVWVKTTTTQGGRIFGFGSSPNGSTSGSYDRHMYMLDNGKIRWGVYNGNTVTLDTTAALNDGAWHYVVTTFGSDGMKLYVDGVLNGSNPNTVAEGSTGYWKLGGDNTWGGNSQMYFDGNVDEAAVYSRQLTLAEIEDHYKAGGGTLPNDLPVVDFAHTPTDLKVDFTSTASDPDGTIESYAWDFGDGATSTEAEPTHTYATGGSRVVSLTVTDDDGGQTTVSHLVTVVAPNVLPTANFTHAVDGLTVAFTSTSTDSDGTLVSYLWDFGDGATSTEVNPTHTYASGASVDVKLTVTDDRAGTDTKTVSVKPIAPNVLPTAQFASDATGLKVDFTSTSTDSDGTIDSYLWEFGDGSTSATATPSHTYASADTYSVKLTVTDNRGGTDAVTKSVTVAPVPNVPPVAAFTSSSAGLTASFSSSGSSDSDGTVESYLWDFGDGASSTSANPSRVYAAAGTYSVKLTVTDDDGASTSITKSVTVEDPPAAGVLAVDGFGRTVTDGFGNADTGGAWTLGGAANLFKVADGVGSIRMASPSAGPKASLTSVASSAVDVSVTYGLDKLADGGGMFFSLGGRAKGTNDYRAKVKIGPDGTQTLYLVRVVSNAETTLGSVALPAGLNYTVGSRMQMRLQVEGTSPTTLRVKVWKVGTSEPSAWTLTRTDSTAGLQVTGGLSLATFLSGTSTNSPVTALVDNLSATTIG